ncbi:hypothetical protein [Thiolapillus sp.]
MIRLFFAGLLVALGGCSSWLPDYTAQDSGWRLVLKKPLTVSADNTRVFLQDGQMLPSLGFNQYKPACNLEVRQLSSQVRTIEPDTFVINRIQPLREEVASWRPVQLVSLRLANAAVDTSPADIFLGYHFWLHSDKQPDVLRMTCRGVFAEPWEAEYPTLEEIAFVLGAYADLQPGSARLMPGQY